MLTAFKCSICGAEGVEHAHEYDGLLGYEAIICKHCGWSVDHNGYQPPDLEHLESIGIKPTWPGPAAAAPCIHRWTVAELQRQNKIMRAALQEISGWKGVRPGVLAQDALDKLNGEEK